MEQVVAVFIPIVSTIVIGLAFVTWIYFRSREKQMIIERGLDTELVKALFEKKKSPYAMLKIGKGVNSLLNKNGTTLKMKGVSYGIYKL